MLYRKRPVVIEAVQWNGENMVEIQCFIKNASWHWVAENHRTELYLETLEGRMKASVGDWVIRGVNGEYYPCKPDIFEQTYDPVENNEMRAI